MARQGFVDDTVTLKVRFFQNGVLFDPFDIQPVRIFDAPIGGTERAVLTATKTAVGKYKVVWIIPSTIAPGPHFDKWTWTAVSGLSSNLNINKFEVNTATELVTELVDSVNKRIIALEKTVVKIINALNNLVTRKELRASTNILKLVDEKQTNRIAILEKQFLDLDGRLKKLE